MKMLKKRYVRVLTFILILIVFLVGRHYYNAGQYFFVPAYEKSDISALLSKEALSEEDYLAIFRNTGVSPCAAKEFIAEDRASILEELNDLYFTKPEADKNYIAYPITYQEENLSQRPPLVKLKKGDILITFNTQTLDWRHGHCGLVLDEEGDLLLEHSSIGNTSCVTFTDRWNMYPGFVVLRHPDPEIAEKAAEYAEKNLIDIKYRITAGIFNKDKTGEENPTSNCSHIVWQAYKSSGVDIDSNKGPVVLPADIAKSEELQVVQIFGINPKDYKDRICK